MFNTTVVNSKTTKQEVHNFTETNIDASGSLSKKDKSSRFININKSNAAFKTIFSSVPFYIEKVQVRDGEIEDNRHRNTFKVPFYKNKETKIYVEVKQILVVGSDYILEVVELEKENIVETFSGTTDKNRYLNTPTIL
jgi:hypothetical protein